MTDALTPLQQTMGELRAITAYIEKVDEASSHIAEARAGLLAASKRFDALTSDGWCSHDIVTAIAEALNGLEDANAVLSRLQIRPPVIERTD